MALSDTTLMLSILLVGAVNAVVLAWAAVLGARRRPALYWAAGSAMLALCAGSVFLVTDPASPWRGLLFNGPGLLSHACWLAGVLCFVERERPLRLLAALVVVCLLAVLWLSLVQPDRDLRIFVGAGTSGVLRLATAFALVLFHGGHSRAVALVAAAVIGVDGVMLVDHALAGLAGAAPSIGTAPNTPRGLTWISMLVSATVATPLLMLLGLSRLLGELRASANQDSLTKLPNRRGFYDRIGPLVAHSRRLKQLGSVLMLDIDRFKTLNDRFGHGVGDDVLRAMGGTLSSVLRGSDTAVRWGGEEFCVLLPGTDGAGAHVSAERIRAEFARRCKAIPGLAREDVSASIGIAYGNWHKVDFDTLQQQADAALYAAKNGGRDRAVLAESRP